MTDAPSKVPINAPTEALTNTDYTETGDNYTADVLVMFGLTGDLGFKKLLPACAKVIKRIQ